MPTDFALPWRPPKKADLICQTQAVNANNAGEFHWFQLGR